MRFLLHGMLFRTRDGKLVVVKSHLLRHYAASRTMPHVAVPAASLGHFGADAAA